MTNGGASRSLSRARWMLLAGSTVVIGLTGAMLSGEVVLRVLRGSPEPPPLDIVIEPGGKFQAPDPVLGFRPNPGSYTVLFDHRDLWHITNLPDTTRITRPLDTYEGRPRGPGIWVDDPANLILYDEHPSAIANEQHAAKMAAILRGAQIVN